MKAYKVFEIKHDLIQEGTRVQKFSLASGTVAIWAVLVGEEGRGRKLGVLPVQGRELPDPASYEGEPPAVKAAAVGTTRSGRPKLVAAPEPNTDEAAIVVLRTRPGYRGGCDHTGDRIGYRLYFGQVDPIFAPFPGQVLAEGYTAQGDAGRMGGGPQIVALVPRGVVFRAGRYGRLYGAPSAHYYVFDGKKILTATWEEREVLPDDHLLAADHRVPSREEVEAAGGKLLVKELGEGTRRCPLCGAILT